MRYICLFLAFLFINCKSSDNYKSIREIENPFNIKCTVGERNNVNIEIINNTIDDYKINKLNIYCYLKISLFDKDNIQIYQKIKIKANCSDKEFVELKHNEKLSFEYDHNLEELFGNKELLNERKYKIQLIYNGKILKNNLPVVLKNKMIF